MQVSDYFHCDADSNATSNKIRSKSILTDRIFNTIKLQINTFVVTLTSILISAGFLYVIFLHI